MATIRETVERELEQLRDDPLALVLYFNNFNSIIPFGYRRLNDDVNTEEFLSEKHVDRGASERRSMRTLGEFYDDVDLAIAEAGLGIEIIEKLQAQGKRAELLKYVAPAYALLREKGYNHYPDLTA